MKSSLIWLLSLLFSLAALGGCAQRPPLVEQPRAVYFREWLPALQERSEHWQNYQARIHLKAHTLDKTINLDAFILAKLPDRLRLEAFRLGQTVAVLTLNGGQPSLFVPSEKVVYTAERSEKLIDHFLGIALPLDTFGYCLSASLPPDQLDTLQMVPDDGEVIGYTKPSLDGWSYAWHFLASPQTVKSVNVKRGTWDYTIAYEPPVGLATHDVPKKLTFTSAQWQIELTVREITSTPVLQDSVFNTEFAGQFRRVDLNSTE